MFTRRIAVLTATMIALAACSGTSSGTGGRADHRTSRSGQVMGPDERLTPLEALKAITLWGAYQHFEEDRKGSIAVGKLADLVILSDNPLTVDPTDIGRIQVLETIKEGRTVFRAR